MTERKRVLITGAAGRIGRSLGEHLGERYRLRLLYHRTIPAEHEQAAVRSRETGKPEPLDETPDGEIKGAGHDVFVADAADLAAMEKACAGVDAVAHMAADPRVNAPWASILNANIVATYNVYEAARRAGCTRVVFASSNHATGYHEKEGTYTTPEMPVRPDSYYGVSKVFGEAMGRYYADAHGLAAVCLRIGSFQPRPRGARNLSTWLSHRDMAQLTWRAIESDVKFLVCYGISGNTRAYWDIASAREQLGYDPEDNAEEYAEDIVAAEAARRR